MRIAGRTFSLAGVNTPGSANELVLYTGAFGAGTPNRAYWLDVSVAGGRVTAKSSYPRAGSTSIPAGGFVLSGHNVAADWLVGVQVGQPVELLDGAGRVTGGGGSGSAPAPTPAPTPVPAPSPAPVPSVQSSWPTNMIGAYKPMFGVDHHNLSSISPSVNVVFLAFANQSSGRLALCGYSGQGKASLMADIKARQAAGVKISVSIGGAGYPINTADTAKFVKEFIAIGQDLSFTPDGIDWDLEHRNNTAEIVAISTALKAKYGPKFGVTFTVGGVGSQADIDNRINTGVALQRAGALDAYGWQFYDAEVSLPVAKWRLQDLINKGIPANKLVIGMMLGSTSKYWTLSQTATNARDIKATMGITKTALWPEARTWTGSDALWAASMKSIFG